MQIDNPIAIRCLQIEDLLISKVSGDWNRLSEAERGLVAAIKEYISKHP